ncbi:aromatic amino acid lyase, partial [Arthrobacter deserti]|nr:aromatic amino acid lyase [Arthrobacter deserti]
MTTAQLATVVLGTSGATAEDGVAVARHGARVGLSPQARAEVARVRAHVDALARSDTPVYGISTGFGALATKHIPADYRTQLQ